MRGLGVTCHICIGAEKPVNGILTCPASGKNFVLHVLEKSCPRGWFEKCLRCEGPSHLVPECPIPPDTSPEKEKAKAQQGGCCGAPSVQIENIPTLPVKNLREKYNFCYFTGSNRTSESPMIESMIKSARRAGVAEDIHVFATADVAGGINHRISSSRSWKNHMTKFDLLLEMNELDYDYFVWLDSDNYFVRDPGDLRDLIRDNPVWVSTETNLQDIVHGDWYEMQLNGTPSLLDLMIGAGCPKDKTLGTNGGMWICRREAIQEFHRCAYAAWDYFKQHGFPRMTDEPPLAVVASQMIGDPQNNTVEKCGHVWACDWIGRYREKLPDGNPWLYKDWQTQKDIGYINPAIVHNMRGKHLMSR